MKRIVSTLPLLALAFLACGEAGEQSGDNGTDAGVPDVGVDGSDVLDREDADASVLPDAQNDAADASDAMVDVDSADTADATDTADTADTADGSDVGDPTVCACDVTDFCDDDCSCDIACSVEAGPPPLGPESIGLERNEIAVFHASGVGGSLNALSLYNDGSAGGFPRHPSMRSGNLADLSLPAVTTTGLRPMGLSADVDGDGRDEAIVVTPTGVLVADWDGTAMTHREVLSYAEAESFDAATGDLDHNGRRQLVLSRQVGDLVTIDVLEISEAGTATLRASRDVPGVSRHAIAVGAPNVGERPRIHLVTTGTPSAYWEPAELLVLGLEGGTLVVDDRVTMAPFCGVGSSQLPSEDGFTLLVGDMVESPGTELFVAAFCEHPSSATGAGGAVFAAVYNREGTITHSGAVGGPYYGTVYTGGGWVRPPAALGYFDRFRGEPGVARFAAPVVAWNDRENDPFIATFGSLNTSGTTSIRWGQGQLPVSGHTVVTGLAARDVDGDGVDEIIASTASGFNPCSDLYPCFDTLQTSVTAFYADSRNTTQMYTSGDLRGSGADLSGPVIAVGDFDQDTMRIRSTGNAYRFLTGAQVNAVVAAPPTWHREGVSHADGSETSFGQSESSGVTHGGSLSYGGSVSIGIGVSLYKLLELYGEVYASFGVTHSWEFEQSVTLGQAITAGSESDLVAYSRAIYVQYEYEVISHPDPEMIGELMTIDEVDSVVQATTSLSRFYATIPNAELLVPPTLLAHVVGDPTTYGRPGTCTFEDLQERIGGGEVSAVYESPALTEVGDAASGYRTLTVDVGTQTETGVDATFELGAMVGATLVVGGTVTAYVGGGYAYRNTVGSEASYAGSVGAIAEGYGNDTRFQWGLCLFHWADQADEPQYASYPVVTYVVKPY